MPAMRLSADPRANQPAVMAPVSSTAAPPPSRGAAARGLCPSAGGPL